MDIKRDLEFREQLKEDIAKKILNMEVKNKEQQIEKCDLGLRLLKFFQFEEDPEFEKVFDEFCKKKARKEKNIVEEEER